MNAVLPTVLTSAVIAALVSALISLLNSERQIAAQNVIQERKEWRNKIRLLASAVHKALVPEVQAAKLNVLRAKLSLLINPHDAMDEEILQIVAAGDAARADEFTLRIALLLKHDWERAKYEASFWRWLRQRTPERVAYKDYRAGVPHDYRIWRCPDEF
jgi:hypothetical protein